MHDETTHVVGRIVDSIDKLRYDLVVNSSKWYNPNIVGYIGHKQYKHLMIYLGPNMVPQPIEKRDYIEFYGATLYRVLSDDHLQVCEVK